MLNPFLVSICHEPHLRITPNPAGSPHSISQLPNADRHRKWRTNRHGEKRENASKNKKMLHRNRNIFKAVE